MNSKFGAYSTEKNGRIICLMLVIVDIILGGSATFFPRFYASIFHPNLTDIPIDFIVRTGILWLIFMVFQLCGAFSKEPKKWFFSIGIIRLMEVPADTVYSILARGATTFSRLIILSAPILNSIFGIILLIIVKKMEKYGNLVLKSDSLKDVVKYDPEN